VLILTHDDADHVGGLIDVLRSSIPVESVIYPSICALPFAICTSPAFQEVITELQKRGLTPTPAIAPQTYTWGAINASVLNPVPAPTEHPDENSVVLLVVYGKVRFLFAADIGSHTERILMHSETLRVLLPADVLKVAQHGGNGSSSSAFLEAVGAKVAVISAGANNPYGHPAQETLDRLRAAGASVLRTDQNGTVVVTTDGQTYKVRAHWVVFLPGVVGTDTIPANTPKPLLDTLAPATGRGVSRTFSTMK
jgi:competence protein ComEC